MGSAARDASGSPAKEASAGPTTLFLPDAAAVVTTARRDCPKEMVAIGSSFCIDRFEATLRDVRLNRALSPFFHPTLTQSAASFRRWQTKRFTMGRPRYQEVPVPPIPPFQITEKFQIKAVVQAGVSPQGYMSGVLARQACDNAGKRLCTETEWVTACRGELDRDFPYGERYERGACNVHNGAHPAKILHGNASLGHLDPRLNAFAYQGRPLLHATGANARCASRWGDDAVFDMVGNIDEWIDDAGGAFVGGFYARNTKEGCASKIVVHPPKYFDYSLGVRCCL